MAGLLRGQAHLGGWYILRSGELGQVSRPASRITYSTIEEAVAEFVVRELDYWMEPDEFPPGWNKTLSVLIAELTESRRPIGPPETEWARAYERSLLRPWARFPVDGEVYETLEDTPIKFLTHWRAPFTDGGEGILPKGTQVRVKIPDWIRSRLVCLRIPSMFLGLNGFSFRRTIARTLSTVGSVCRYPLQS